MHEFRPVTERTSSRGFRVNRGGPRCLVLFAIGLIFPGCDRADSTPERNRARSRETTDRQQPADVKPPLNSPAGAASAPDRKTLRAQDWFEDATHRAGVDFAYRNGMESGHYFILESLGGGAAMIDFDRDGDLDLFFTGGGTIRGSPVRVEGLPSAMFRNDGGLSFVDVTTAAGFGHRIDYSHGCAVSDFDADGFPDLFVCCYGRSRLYRNSGCGWFTDVTESSGLIVDGWSTAAAWADVNKDGWPDLFIVRYLDWSPETDRPCKNRSAMREVCGPRSYRGVVDKLFRNRGDGTFEDVSKHAGLNERGNGLGVVAADLNGDGWIDFYVANDETNNHLYLGRPQARFQESAFLGGVATNEYGMHDGSMGLDVGDYDGDGRPDIWVTNFEAEDNGLYKNVGNASFSHSTAIAGLAGHSRPLVGFGTALHDFDSDGWPDIFVANGHVFYHGGQAPYRQPAQLFRNLEGKRFLNASQQGGSYFRVDHAGRGTAVGDLDGDGAIDIVVVHQNEPVAILRNRKTPANFVGIRLRGVSSEPHAVGAKVTCHTRGRTLVSWICSGAGYFSHFDQQLIFPLGDNDLADVTVTWLDGTREKFRDLKPGGTRILIEGQGQPHDPE